MRGKFIAEVEYDRYLIECRGDVAEGINAIARRFDEWLHDRNNDHGLWVALPDNAGGQNDPDGPADPYGGFGVSYGISDFLGWLNQNYNCEARVIADEKAGAHHIDEYNAWLRERGLIRDQVHFAATLEEYNRLNGTDFSEWGGVIKPAPEESAAREYRDPFRYFEEFEKSTGLTPEILRLHREENVPFIYF